MENEHSTNTNSLTRRHFAGIHEKVQNKYMEMQKKLEKSKSIDSILTLEDEYIFEHQKYLSIYSSKESFKNSGDTENKIPLVRQSVPIQEINKFHVIFEEVSYDKSSAYSKSTPVEENAFEGENLLTQTFSCDNFSTSYESLNELPQATEKGTVSSIEKDALPPTPPPRITIRNRIGSRLALAKERRREKERNSKKKDSKPKVEKLILSNSTKLDIVKDVSVKKRNKTATVTIAIIKTTLPEDEAFPDEKLNISCRLRLGLEKRKSKSVKINSTPCVITWHELFHLSMYDDNLLEIFILDNKDNLFGRSIVDLSKVAREKTHKMRLNLEDGVANAQIFILLTISGVLLENTFADLDDYEETQRKLNVVERKFAWYRLCSGCLEVGWLFIIVYGAKGLCASDCFCILELENERRQTHTEYKTSDPNWMKIFTFSVKDITSHLEVTIHDEKKSEDIGKVSIPLLKINNRKSKWVALKDITQRERAKGNNPRLLLEMTFTWNLLKASTRVLNPKEVKYMASESKFDRHIFSRNISRAKAVLDWILDAFKVIKMCFEWDSKKMNVVALTIWLLFCWFFKIWMLPLLILIPFIWYRPPKYYLVNWQKRLKIKRTIHEKEEKNTSLRQKINSLQDMVLTVQKAIGKFASLGESMKNLCNFTVPFLSFLAIFIIVVIAFLLFVIPVKYIFMIWGIHKFTRKILRPKRVPNNEILDLLSRVPDDDTLLDCEELPLQQSVKDDDLLVL